MTRATLRTLPLLLAALLGGCSLFLPAPEAPTVISLIDQVPAQLPHRAAGAATLLVLTPEARPAIDSTQMAYTLRPHHIAYFAHNQWAETPAQMLQPLLVRTMESTGAFAAVLTPPQTGSPRYALRCEILDLVQDYTQEPPVLRLALRVQLSDESAQRMLATREWTLREPMAEKTPRGGVLAANAAMAQALREMAGLVLETAR